MRSELITIPTATTPLDGVLYEPEGGCSVRSCSSMAIR